MEKIFWTQIRESGYQFSLVPASKQAGVKALAVADVKRGESEGGITAERYEELIGEKYVEEE